MLKFNADNRQYNRQSEEAIARSNAVFNWQFCILQAVTETPHISSFKKRHLKRKIPKFASEKIHAHSESSTLTQTDRKKTALLSYAMPHASDASYTSAGMTSSPMTKFFAILAYLKSHSLFTNEYSVFSAMSPEFRTLYQPMRSFESAPMWEMGRNGDVPVVGHPPPGFIRSATTWQMARGPAAGGG